MIYLDVSAAVHRRAGLGRYAESLVRALVAWAQTHPDEALPFALFYNRGRGSRPLAGLEHLPARTVRAGYKPWRMAIWLGQLARIPFNRLLPGATLYHATEHLLMPLRNLPTVLTVHDLIFELFPRFHKPLNYWYLHWTMPLYCRRADRIIAVSQATRRDLTQHYGVAPERITVVYEAAAPHFRPASPQAIAALRARYALPDRFLLHVGTIEPRKNLERLLDALALLRRQGQDVYLVLAGGKGWLYEGFFRKLERFPHREAVRWLGYVPDEALPALYSAATLCVVPSLYEGFGLPVLEAMACGTPVVCSRSGSLPEVGGAAARYFDPNDVEAMAAAIGAVWQDGDAQAAMREQGLAQAARFSWERAAEETMAVYRRLKG